MDDNEYLKNIAKALGLEENHAAAKLIAIQGITESANDIGRIITFIKTYKVFSEESIKHMEKIITEYMTGLELILRTEWEIDVLRQSD